ncbi:cyclophilin-like fold protein [Shewanella amazonensis]|uniref:Cyclophilin-like domain-containing protein n=1 Tax=Shewanella amazonensis (strain ATCC BAA-1098 / SB2B) TaxID=326297 RepID=A1S956_SHEAM|nr:cyclophilin-like fold protein [Shewanella amazonensis]ABM00913.1 conserved hypothetical protein [Shewanella amazonensis SB2B]
MNIRLLVNGTVIHTSLDDSAAARDFFALLPLSLTLTDYAGTEKIAYLDTQLSTAGLPAGTAANTGDICYYAPWGNLAFFYRDFGYARGLIKLGRLPGDCAWLTDAKDIELVIEKEALN